MLRPARVIPSAEGIEHDSPTDGPPLEDAGIDERVWRLNALVAKGGIVEWLSLRAAIMPMVR